MVDIQKAMNEASSTAGGSFVPDEQAKEFLALVQQTNTAMPLCRSFTMATDVLNVPTISAGNTAYWIGENTNITSSDATTGSIILTAKKCAALSTVASELIDDANPEIAQTLNEQLAKDVAISVDQQIYNGGLTGYTSSGIKGFRDTTTYTDMNSISSSGGTGDEISVAKILAAKKLIKEDYFAEGGTHLVINPALEYKLMSLVDSNGRPLFSAMDTDNPLYSNGVIGKILGLTVVVTPAIPSNVSKGGVLTLTDAIVLTANVSGYIGTKRSFKFHKEYQIDSDNWKIQTNMRMAFTVAYQKSACIIKELATA